MGLLREGRMDHACAYLFFLHKNHMAEWLQVKRGLLGYAKDQKTLQRIATVIDVSRRETLMESASVIPGLGSLMWSSYSPELLD